MNNEQTVNVTTKTMPVFTLAALVLLILKLIGYNISWAWIIGVFLFPIVFGLIILALIFVVGIISAIILLR